MAKSPPPIYAPIRGEASNKIGAVDTMNLVSEGNRVMLELQGDLADHRGYDVRWSARVPLPAGWSLVRAGESDGN